MPECSSNEAPLPDISSGQKMPNTFRPYFQTAFAAEAGNLPRVTLFSNFESDYCKLFRFETRCRQIEMTCPHIAWPYPPAISSLIFPIHLQTAFYEVMGGEQTKRDKRRL